MSLNADISASTNFTEEQLAGYIIGATSDVFSTMVMMDIQDEWDRNLLFRCRLYTTGNGITSMDCRDFWGEIGNYPGRF